MVAGGFEPPKHNASDLKSLPFDQTREYYQVPYTNEGLLLWTGFEPVLSNVNDTFRDNFYTFTQSDTRLRFCSHQSLVQERFRKNLYE